MEKQITGNYFALPNGEIKTYNWRNSKKEAILRPAIDSNGYKRVALMIDGKLVTKKVHRLIAECFVPNPENKPEVNHIDYNKTNNSFENLEWVTRKENMAHASANGLLKKSHEPEKYINKVVKKGSDVATSILQEYQVLEIRSKFKKRICTRDMLALEYGVKSSTIKDVVLRKSWRHI